MQLHIHIEVKHNTENNEIEPDQQESDKIYQMLARHQV